MNIRYIRTIVENIHVYFKSLLFSKISNCGKGCIELLLKRYNREYPEISMSVPLTTMKDISDFLHRIGLVSRGLKFSDVQSLLYFYATSNNNIILHLEWKTFFSRKIRHWVLLESIDNNTVVLLDPFQHKVCYGIKQFEKMWTGYALVVEQE